MNRKLVHCLETAFLVLSLLLAGCGANPSDAQKSLPGEGTFMENAVTVGGTEELLEAIRPGAEIVLTPGRYDLSAYIDGIWEQEGETWNSRHEYVQLQDCYDGAEILVRGVDGLSITGQSDTGAQELVIEPRYATVFSFENCSAVKLSNLTLGHTEGGECSGNVLDFYACSDVELRGLDLYGCGSTGIECGNGTGNVSVYDSIIRDCSNGPLFLYDCTGKFAFHNCALTGSEDGVYFLHNEDDSDDAELAFYQCSFGEMESASLAFREDVYTEDCSWTEIEEYADDTDVEIILDLEALETFPLDEESFGDTGWTCYSMFNQQSGESVAPPSGEDAADVYMILRGEGTGVLHGYFPESVPFLWEHDSDNPENLICQTRNSGNFYATTYQNKENWPTFWLSLQIAETGIWMY